MDLSFLTFVNPLQEGILQFGTEDSSFTLHLKFHVIHAAVDLVLVDDARESTHSWRTEEVELLLSPLTEGGEGHLWIIYTHLTDGFALVVGQIDVPSHGAVAAKRRCFPRGWRVRACCNLIAALFLLGLLVVVIFLLVVVVMGRLLTLVWLKLLQLLLLLEVLLLLLLKLLLMVLLQLLFKLLELLVLVERGVVEMGMIDRGCVDGDLLDVGLGSSRHSDDIGGGLEGSLLN